MDMPTTSGSSWSTIPCVVALVVIVVAFRLADVGPTAAASALRVPAVEAPWESSLRSLDAALQRGDAGAANRTWHEGYSAVLASGRWDGFVAMGDAVRRIADAAGSRSLGEARSRSLYLAALFRARQQGTVDGVLRAAEAFAGLGDREVVEQCLIVARALAARDGDKTAEGRVQTITARLAAK
jgi:hypothetical protein